MPVILIFLDGVGLAPAEKNNPFATTPTPFLSGMLDGGLLTLEAAGRIYPRAALLALDATLGVDGLPQSATGQATIFTGENAPRLLGYHLNGFPVNKNLRRLLAEKGMFRHFQQQGLRCTFANAYKPEFFRHFDGTVKRSYSCSTLINLYAGLPFHTMEDMLAGKAVYMDITNDLLRKLGYDVPVITPQQAGRRLVNVSRHYDLILYEHFLTDLAGHDGDWNRAGKVIRTLDAFLGAVVESMNPESDLLLVVSDHGNLEDLQTKTHTMNPVPALIIGRGREQLINILQDSKDLTGIIPALTGWFRSNRLPEMWGGAAH